ncbi:MAG: DUF2760 domain-containing protein [Verrucomicrobiae bacterium]
MAKKLLIGAAGGILVLNVGILVFPDPNATVAVEIFSALCGMAFLFLGARAEAQPARPSEPASVCLAPPRPEAEIIAFLALLQEHGRLVDFAREEIAGATDAQVGAAARVVHAGCRKVLDEYFDIQPVHPGQEGDRVALEPGYDAAAHRLLGMVPDRPPYQGKLLHPGWMSPSVKLPRITGITERQPWPVIAPAEVELR